MPREFGKNRKTDKGVVSGEGLVCQTARITETGRGGSIPQMMLGKLLGEKGAQLILTS